MDGVEEVRDGILVSGLGKWTENGQSCQHVHSFTHPLTDLSSTHPHTHTVLTCLQVWELGPGNNPTEQ